MAAAFGLYGLVATAFLALNMPPFQNPDEHAHFLRAAQVAGGRLLGARFADDARPGQVTAGGLVDPALLTASGPFNGLIFHPELRAVREDWAPRIAWSDERATMAFANTAINPPVFYLPAAAGVGFGRWLHLTVVQTLVLSRVLTGLAAVAVGAAAIALSGRAAPWLFAVLTLPMSLSLLASTSPDALMLAGSALAGGLAVRLWDEAGPRRAWLLAAMAAALALVAMARGPYAGLALVPLAIPAIPLRARLIAAGAVAATAVAWSVLSALTTLTNFGAQVGADPAAQLALLAHNPLSAVPVLWRSVSEQWPAYIDIFVGTLGWLDTPLPAWYHRLAWLALAAGALAAMLGRSPAPAMPGRRLLVAAALLLSAVGLFAAQYITWTAPGFPTVQGVHGRYFLPLALAGAALLPSLGLGRLAFLRQGLAGAVLLFPLVSLAVVMRAVVLRYYLG
jgi:uncharacterized membrane protein